MIKTLTETKITYKKNGNIKTITTPYDDNSILQNPIDSVAIDNHNTLLNIFEGFGDAYLMGFNN